ncbi:hypothetical protein ACLIJY_08435 [Staphylococcus arlettae]|uniref:Membrane protein n=1 Tax=Staphylococcus arlettae TaxID=29378 RepID=A0A380CUD5_9STAP|nr:MULTISPECIES: hypothetical protein [Staphylococcus]MCD8834113.1 hypothetical protein [Staphylococcus arlettae]MCD8841004.1 hypothetical protein [Staphylococcus arlettae]MCD8864280.1 hypothetical protein [Staphylococcus arlettae]MEB5898957.1 hypothetical protein [Staphylococcus arlettae]PNZ52866.1 hypothetical protein CD036_10435 [Staphylococcus arlettae]
MNNQTHAQDIQGGRVLAAISYFSIFFAPLILPLIVWIFAYKPASTHAMKALIYHIITLICPFFLIFSGGLSLATLQDNTSNWVSVVGIMITLLFIILTIWYTIKNVYRGVKVLISKTAYFYP